MEHTTRVAVATTVVVVLLPLLLLATNTLAIDNYDATTCPLKTKNDTDTEAAAAAYKEDPMLSEACVDSHNDCEWWASEGECENNPGYMWNKCRRSCNTCYGYKAFRYDDTNNNNNNNNNMGKKQRLNGPLIDELMAFQLEMYLNQTKDYYRNVLHTDPKYLNVRDRCKNKNPECTLWAVSGECDENPDYMRQYCPLACQTCIELDYNHRCFFDETEPKAWQEPGDLNRMFTRLATDPYYLQYNPRILSRPKVASPNDKDKVVEGPWVVTLENFLTDEECDTLIDLGYDLGYARSKDVGDERPDGTYGDQLSKDRTSRNAWCDEYCSEDPHTMRIMNRIENITGIPQTNSESLQILKYETGQFYRTHHDCIPYQRDRQCGVRILTVFLYLNDVEEGGGTNFPKLNITVMPKKGRALLWPSVFDSDPDEGDYGTDHQALPVEAGIKFGANAWIHQRSWEEAAAKDCT